MVLLMWENAKRHYNYLITLTLLYCCLWDTRLNRNLLSVTRPDERVWRILSTGISSLNNDSLNRAVGGFSLTALLLQTIMLRVVCSYMMLLG